MLTLQQIEKQYPENLQPFKRGILREYLQYKILEIIFSSKFANKLSFMGGTVLRLIYGNTRFSEDLDFDNFALSEKEFDELSGIIKKSLELQGLKTEISTVAKGAFRCNIRLPEILFENNLSLFKEEKILIQVDSFAQNFDYKPEKKNLNKFDVFSEIFITPPDILLSQKIYAIFNRKRAKGRDFYDIVFLLSFTKPNYKYLKQKLDINSPEELKRKIISLSVDLNFEELAKDAEMFLFSGQDSKKIKSFVDYIKQIEL
ncbi:MAG: hypothetical protein A2312_01900 [Candidatus Staskawiczbacteria bacterium RIFOXYB2_FULL_32_9]|uniref:Nucleotidyl transferase AbiEii/AbiGii toxin family protein n=1 Tax=Candidatus Staskawiczbacteria bacterium RIFOXYD1_FULL_32_13 TaxID=1802234 RepID=A0A1G2JKT4_9BACT|nr:MAG: hypothetical protein UR22_C0001G0106 [Parcubacteria group bacterium GW2011_GWC2_32_10]OGZ77326.1 MAG: hypothetical protein A2256_03710 [Candidatus Staskawiczbacteria bacterium RIFOXYA2_FULL_32_7]OGZ77824.1 MAG: hypothetical protein A2360_04470 [Candidatus Staskawiczbacteria bacterium RIFOXYB1_FULL_32_11]OGZ82123.1 MAG: hypothetical protein A2312_01900 [Candidatus Staskawiczbacteria bacterium RIFOXYB2_FULL_32_9]OGZ87287.1 MAG: hypothetical protein A2463_02910 [Candidatus Staskawiczbacter